MNYELLTTENAPVKMWTKGVPVEADARQQLINTAKMPFIFKHIAVMPDVHLGLMNPLMILVKIIKLRWIHILSYDQMVSR
ncbi:hypothetical protein SNA07_00325, partial [Escherichia coli]|nr:hypothetical protein [Escherichia coli]